MTLNRATGSTTFNPNQRTQTVVDPRELKFVYNRSLITRTCSLLGSLRLCLLMMVATRLLLARNYTLPEWTTNLTLTMRCSIQVCCKGQVLRKKHKNKGS
jgi:hypothetical protein